MINGRPSEWSVACSVIPPLLSPATGLAPGWGLGVRATEAGPPPALPTLYQLRPVGGRLSSLFRPAQGPVGASAALVCLGVEEGTEEGHGNVRRKIPVGPSGWMCPTLTCALSGSRASFLSVPPSEPFLLTCPGGQRHIRRSKRPWPHIPS